DRGGLLDTAAVVVGGHGENHPVLVDLLARDVRVAPVLIEVNQDLNAAVGYRDDSHGRNLSLNDRLHLDGRWLESRRRLCVLTDEAAGDEGTRLGDAGIKRPVVVGEDGLSRRSGRVHAGTGRGFALHCLLVVVPGVSGGAAAGENQDRQDEDQALEAIEPTAVEVNTTHS